MTPPIRPEPDETAAEFARWKAEQEFRDWQATQQRNGPSERERAARARAREAQNAEEMRRAKSSFGEEMATAAVSALDAGTFGLAGLATDALSEGSFRQNRDARSAAYQAMPTYDRVLSGLAGGLANPVSRVIPGAAATPKIGLLRVAGRGVREGAAQGALTGFGENIGTTDGALDDAALGGAVGGLFGGAIAPVAARVATSGRYFADPLTQHLPFGLGANAAGRRAEELASIAAAQRASTSVAADAAFPARPLPPTLPNAMALDVAGPATMAQARGAARTIEGREAFRGPFAAREADMVGSVTANTPDAVQVANELRGARKAQADADYSQAVEATKGRPVETPLLDALLETPTGKAAWREVQKSRPDLVLATDDPARALPTVEREVIDGVSPNAPEGFEATSALGGRTVQRQVPDAEAIHLMTRYLRNWSKGEPGQVFPDGVNAESASHAGKLLERAKEELPELFRLANERYAAASRGIDAVELGRTPWKVNPKPGKRSVPMADVEARVRGMTPDERGLLNVGKQFDLSTRVNEGSLTPRKAAERMARPQSSLARELALSGGDMGGRLQAWDNALSRQADVLSGPEPKANSRGGLLDEASRDVAPSAWWTAIKAARNRLSAAAMREAGTNDAAFAFLLTSKPEDWTAAITNLAKRDKKAADAAREAARFVGRQGGLLSRYQ